MIHSNIFEIDIEDSNVISVCQNIPLETEDFGLNPVPGKMIATVHQGSTTAVYEKYYVGPSTLPGIVSLSNERRDRSRTAEPVPGREGMIP
jgi:hypothetical protein